MKRTKHNLPILDEPIARSDAEAAGGAVVGYLVVTLIPALFWVLAIALGAHFLGISLQFWALAGVAAAIAVFLSLVFHAMRSQHASAVQAATNIEAQIPAAGLSAGSLTSTPNGQALLAFKQPEVPRTY